MELALFILVLAAFVALVMPSIVGVLLDPERFKERPTPPSLAPPKERNRFGLPNWVLMPRLRRDRPSQPSPEPTGRSADPRSSVGKPGAIASLSVRRKRPTSRR